MCFFSVCAPCTVSIFQMLGKAELGKKTVCFLGQVGRHRFTDFRVHMSDSLAEHYLISTFDVCSFDLSYLKFLDDEWYNV